MSESQPITDVRATLSGGDAAPRQGPAGAARPAGFVKPQSERGVRALKALEDGRLADAETNIAAITDSPPDEYAWKCHLGGLLAAARCDPTAALPLFLQAAGSALVEAYGRVSECDCESLRLAASALDKAGALYRRYDRPADATQAHAAALQLRKAHGSVEEEWETAVNLGLDADLARRYADAAAWHRTAVELGSRASEESARLRAIASSHLSKTLLADEDFQGSVAAARDAGELWRKHDAGELSAIRAELNLGHALLKLGESLHGDDVARARSALDEALTSLNGASKELAAFGPQCGPDVKWSEEQIDFAKRLLDSLDA
jgi:hypothetical protein